MIKKLGNVDHAMNLPTGVMVQYYKACKRELWFFANHINMDYTDDNIKIGKHIHENTYTRDRKNIDYGDIIPDFVRVNDEPVIFEIKKSSKLIEPAKYQLYYYLWYLKSMGKEVKGILAYPKERMNIEVTLTPEIEKEIEVIINDIPNIISLSVPPKAEIKPYCKHCAYYELCVV